MFNPLANSTYKKDMNLLDSGVKLHIFGGSELLASKFGFLSKLKFLPRKERFATTQIAEALAPLELGKSIEKIAVRW